MDEPWQRLDCSSTPDGGEMSLWRHGRHYAIWVDDIELMVSQDTGSEKRLASLVCQEVKSERPRVLVGGLGMGFTLRAALDSLPSDAEIVVAELMPSIVTWNENILGHLTDHPLKDPRVVLAVGDVAHRFVDSRFDAVMLDVDNGPSALSQGGNHDLYTTKGLNKIKQSLLPGGVLGVWSTDPDRGFELRLEDAGYVRETVTGRISRSRDGLDDTVFLAWPKA